MGVMLMKSLILFLVVVQSLIFSLDANEKKEGSEKKVIICGVCRDVAPALPNTISNIEKLGSHYADYAVIIYENNSKDQTATLLNDWMSKNPHVHVITENLTPLVLSSSKTERIARGRNIVLSIAKEDKYQSFEYLIMADLDFRKPWPIDEINTTINCERDWDCVCAHGIGADLKIWDVYAYRDKKLPLGPELLGDYYWEIYQKTRFRYEHCLTAWQPVYSAFGGLAIYKTKSIIESSYNGSVTESLAQYYNNILKNTPLTNEQYEAYLKLNGIDSALNKNIPIIFRKNTPWHQPNSYPQVTCCEHLPFHASMVKNGYGNIYVNPKMIIYYQ